MRLAHRPQDGSIPMAMLAAIVVAGLVIVLTATILQSERSVRFDRAYTDVVQTADAGAQVAYHRLNEAAADPTLHPALTSLTVGQTSPPFTTDLDDARATWTVRRSSPRQYEITSTGRTPDDVERTVVVTVEKDSLFFPGAFGDRLVAMNGTSTQIDSYESVSPQTACLPKTADKCWGTDDDFGTRKAALGTNNDFDFSGNVKVLRGILYDWAENPGAGTSPTDPGGDRCKGNPCTEPDVIRTEDEDLEYGSDDQMQFISDKLGACTSVQERGNWVLGNSKKNDPAVVLSPYAGGDNTSSPVDPSHTRYYCADSLQIVGDVVLSGATPADPVVIFVRDSYSQAGHTTVNLDCLATDSCPDISKDWRDVRPKAESLQIYVQTEAPAKGANVMVDQHAVFAGVMYSPRATCGGSGNAGAHMFGSMICRTVDNVGNWRFHYDESLANATRGSFSMASWREE